MKVTALIENKASGNLNMEHGLAATIPTFMFSDTNLPSYTLMFISILYASAFLQAFLISYLSQY